MNVDIGSRQLNILTVGLDDYYQSAALQGAVSRHQWHRFESRLEKNAYRALEILAETSTKATFFVTASVADKHATVVQEIARQGHEIASQGYAHRNARRMSRGELHDDLRCARETLQQITGRRIFGNRCMRPLISREDLWILDVVCEEGYAYDSSLLPLLRIFGRDPWRRFVHTHMYQGNRLWEVPFSTWSCLGFSLPIAGGVYLRQIPFMLHRQMVSKWHERYSAPFVMYFHVWELDSEQPQINTSSSLQRIRHYRNLGKTGEVVRRYLAQYRYGPAEQYLQLARKECEVERSVGHSCPGVTVLTREGIDRPRTPVTIVIPLYNEQANLTYFCNTLETLEKELGDYSIRFVFVDDGSSDKTLHILRKQFGKRPDCLILHHAKNLGVTAAIMTGIRNSTTEIVCSMDSDCTYDPGQLKLLIPELVSGIDLVTGSPYHPRGRVVNVPAWRLILSKSASFLYRHIIRQKLYTYTACFRVYRRSALKDIRLEQSGFLGMPEMIGRLDLAGARVREVPATLETRLLGFSKMRLVPVIWGHLNLMFKLVRLRLNPPQKVGSTQVHSEDRQSMIENTSTRAAS